MRVRSTRPACYACPKACANAGINTAIYSPSGANSGVGFAIPVDIVRSSVDQIIRFGRVIRPILGISFAPDQSSEQVSPSSLSLLILANPQACLQRNFFHLLQTPRASCSLTCLTPCKTPRACCTLPPLTPCKPTGHVAVSVTVQRHVAAACRSGTVQE